jgi:thiol-disulfide isomerase/thioredoxin
MNPKSFLRKQWLNVLLTGFVLMMLLYTPAKVFMLQRLMDTGLFNASADKKLLKADPMIFKNREGELISTESLKGRTVFINFWASWCPPCLAEMPSIQKLYDRFKNDKRIVFIMADVDHKLNESTSFLSKRSIDLPVYEPHSLQGTALYDGTLPTTLIINKEGMVILHHSGIGRYDTPSIIKLLEDEINH